jgi:hypothetical protein
MTMTETEADRIQARALPVDSWRTKSVQDMNEMERAAAIKDAEEALRAAVVNMNWEGVDPEDVRWAYEAKVRAEQRIAELKAAAQRFDVV